MSLFVISALTMRSGYSAERKNFYQIPLCLVLTVPSSRPSTIDHNARSGTHLETIGFSKLVELPVEPNFYPKLLERFTEIYTKLPAPIIMDLRVEINPADGKMLVSGFIESESKSDLKNALQTPAGVPPSPAKA